MSGSGGSGRSGGVNLVGPVARAEVIVGRDNIHGIDPETLVASMAKGMMQAAKAAGLHEGTIITMARRLKPNEALSLDQAIAELERAVEVALDVIARGERGSNDDAFVGRVLARVAERIKANDLDGGVRAVDEAIAEEEARGKRSLTTLLEEGIKLDTLRRDAGSVARRTERIVGIEQPTDHPAQLPAFQAKLHEYMEDGEKKGINFSLMVTIELAKRMVATARNAYERGDANNLLGNALATLGQRESGTVRLEEAVMAYRAALEDAREQAPLYWAATQTNLGLALATLGERESGTTRLEEAVAAHRAALEECTRERVPLVWATMQNNLGGALGRLGGRESGTARLEEAVAAYRAALEEQTRERVPLDWATTQNNLGAALWSLGERESGTARLEEAVMTCRAALEERTRERVPLDWAGTQNNLGTALKTLGERESGTARLEEAVSAYRAALEELTRERVPLDWARTQNNLGNTLGMVGERESGTARLEEAVAAWDECLLVAASAWPGHWVLDIRRHRDETLAEIERRRGGRSQA